jgi:hypothetical protein
MARVAHRLPIPFLAILVLALIASTPATAQGGLKTIHPPSGGLIVYGQVDGQSTEAGAMGAILRHIHDSMGDKPEVGKLFDVRGSESVAVFFTVKRRSGDGGQSAGLIIAAKSSTDHVEAALLSDDAPRFSKTLGPMMKTLFSQWHPLAVSDTGAGAADASAGAVPALRQQVLPDRSATVSLPDTWKLNPQSAQGTVLASGSNGEQAALGEMINAEDTNNPRVQQLMRTIQSGGLRNTAYANAFYYPAGGDISRTFVDVLQAMRKRNGAQPAKFNLSGVTPAQSPNPRLRCAQIAGTSDSGDGQGEREFVSIFCVSQPGPAGLWSALVNVVTAPSAVASRERSTMAQILFSYNVNQAVVSGMAAQYAAPSINQSKMYGQMAANQARAAHQMEDIHNSSVYQHWDSMDKRNQEFSNYLLDQTVVLDKDNNAHGTLWNQDADLLVKSDPDRFEYVNAPNYWKGIDY